VSALSFPLAWQLHGASRWLQAFYAINFPCSGKG